jgi:hypothetical protein
MASLAPDATDAGVDCAGAGKTRRPDLAERHRVTPRDALDTRFEMIAATHGVKYVSIYRALSRRDCQTISESGLPIV